MKKPRLSRVNSVAIPQKQDGAKIERRARIDVKCNNPLQVNAMELNIVPRAMRLAGLSQFGQSAVIIIWS